MTRVLDRRQALAAGGGLALVTLSGCGLAGPAHWAGAPAEGASVVGMGLTRFTPDTVTIGVGETVEWRNTSLAPHTVTADPDRADDPDRVQLPAGAEPFHSGTIAPGEIFRHRFDVAGTYVYFCIPHENAGMWGRVVVRPADA